MDRLSPSWFRELEMEDPIFPDQCDPLLDSFDKELAAILGDDFQILPENGSPPMLSQLAVVEDQQNINVPNFDQSSPAMDLGNMSGQPHVDHGQISDSVAKVGKGTKKPNSRTKASQNYDHIVAERKRREQLSQCFVALSAIVPGLKKMDKTSVLGDAIKYLKQLQHKVKLLEDKAREQTVESVILVKKSQLIIEDDNGSSDMDGDGSLPEIEARVCDKSVLIRIHCEKHNGLMIKILSHIEKLNLAIVNTSVTGFGTVGLHITVMAEMEQEFNATLNDIVTTLRSVVRRVRRANRT